ncbi:MAG: GNAT family protein [Candidatus Omnitrophica bacterium]|nr:GNAT family protein [Candidatus Omnitrophota bacterium]MDD5352395.1 GNAT family protein [Candidatus Omnitrophota bacterium]MDD5549993.1 GNAT family protein [Candidatus Omnitrophota bacterium]
MDRPFLVGKKIYLRPFDMSDLNGKYIQWINDCDVTKFMDDPFPKTRENLEEYVKNISKDPNYVFFAVIEKKTDKHIGNAKIGPINWIHRRTGFGRMLCKEAWGKGYGTEAMRLMIEYAFEKLNLNRIIDHGVVDNLPSIKSNEKAGLDNEGIIREYVYSNGKYCDVAILGLTRARYDKKKRQGFFK